MYIPKTNGKLGSPGLFSYEDRLVQAVMADILNGVYELRFLENDIADKNFLRYIVRFLKAGIMDGMELLESNNGTPQGRLVSLALAKFGLGQAEDKTRMLLFGRFKGTKGSFDFLGFTFINTRTRTGKYRVGVISSAKKLKGKKQAVRKWLRGRLTKPISETMELLNLKLAGHYNYYGVSGNFEVLWKFEWYAKRTAYRMFNCRDQKGKMSLDCFLRIWEFYITSSPGIRVDIWGWGLKTA